MKKYQIIYADPPWQYEFSHTRARAITDYPTMDKEGLCNLKVKDLELNERTIKEIEERRKSKDFVSHEEVGKMLGL